VYRFAVSSSRGVRGSFSCSAILQGHHPHHCTASITDAVQAGMAASDQLTDAAALMASHDISVISHYSRIKAARGHY
jgi:hypothetical protein